MKAKLVDLEHQYRLTSPIQKSFLTLEYISALTVLKSNQDIFIPHLDKGFGVVIMNRTDYIQKMIVILGDDTQFSEM